MGKNIVLVYTCTALVIREIYLCTVSTLRGIKSKHSHPINLLNEHGTVTTYDVCTPNGRRETHAIAIEFQQNPSGVLECGSAKVGLLNLTIPRLCKREVASLKLGSKSVLMERYTGPKKVNPPLVVCRSGPPLTDVCALQGSLERAHIKETQWLNSRLHDPNPIEQGGYNAALARVEYSLKPATTYMFGPLIDASSSHPDTVLTTLSYLDRTFTELGMKT